MSSELKAWLKRIPLYRNLEGYSWKAFRSDCKAGLNVALLDFPQGMAYAMIAGLPVAFGIFSSAIGSITGPLLASSRFLMLGPTNATAVLLLSGFLTLNLPEEQKLIALPLLLLMISAILFLGAIFRAEIIIQYVSRSVVTGYITAAALLIIVNQLQHVFGIEMESAGTVWATLVATVEALGGFDGETFAFALGTLALYLIIQRFFRFLPAVAGKLIIVTGVAFLLSKYGFELQTLPGMMAGGWPLTLPIIDLHRINDLLGTAFAIAFLSLLESSSIAKTLAARSGDTVNIRQQMVSMSLANGVNAFGSGMPVSGSLTRSVLNWSSGARTPVSSIVSGVLLVLGIYLLGGFIQYIPKASLAALVITVGIRLIQPENIRTFLKVSRSDATTFLITFAGGLLFPLDTAIYIGVGISILFFLRKVGQPRLREYDFIAQGELAEKGADTPRKSVSIVHVEGDLFFGSTDIFQDQARELVRTPNLQVMILRLLNAHHIDASASLAIRELVGFARSEGREVLISGIRGDIRPILERAGIIDLVGQENMFDYTPENVTLSTRNALKRAQAIIGEESAEILLWAKERK